MKFKAQAAIGLLVLALAAAWPLWHAQGRNGAPGPAAEQIPDPLPPLPEAGSSVSGASTRAASPQAACSGCAALKRLARRLRAREEGAARRFEAAANRLAAGEGAAGPGTDRRQLELALRRAQDDKRGAAALRMAALQAIETCASGAGCGETALAAHWEGGCPPEEPDLERESRALAELARVLARKAGACAAAACPEFDCKQNARMVRLLSVAERDLTALEDPPAGAPGPAGTNREAVRALLKESEDWRGRIAALFLGGPEPEAQIRAAAEAAKLLASRLSEVRGSGNALPANPNWRLQVLSVRLERTAEALTDLASAMASGAPDRGAALYGARAQAATAFRELLITQMRIHAAQARAGPPPEGAASCARRRRAQIARARGLLRPLRAALRRCARRAACGRPVKAGTEAVKASALDPVSALRLRLDRTSAEAEQLARRLEIGAQPPVTVDTVRPRYESGEAVPARIDLRATACMAEEGAWVGLFPESTPPLRGGEVTDAVIRRVNLRGRPWEEILFEAPSRPGAYEVRTYAARTRGGAITGRARFEVTPREAGCRGFSGVWKTNFGRLKITVRDGEARGSYRRHGAWRAGFLTGDVNGRVLFGEWQSEMGAGGTRLVLSKDGKSFSGTWSHFRDEFAGTGVWKGTCAGPVKEADDQEGEE